MPIPTPGDTEHTLGVEYCFKIFQIKFFSTQRKEVVNFGVLVILIILKLGKNIT